MSVMDSRAAHIDTAPDAVEEELSGEETMTSMHAVPVIVENTVQVLSQKAANAAYDIYASYTTYVLPASSAGNISVAQILPQDPNRIQAIVKTANANVVLCSKKDQAQAVGNLQATSGTTNFPPGPQGALISPSQSVPSLENNETLWVANCDPALIAYVTVIIERGGA